MRMMKRSAGSNPVVWLVSEKVTFPKPVEKSHFMYIATYIMYCNLESIGYSQFTHTPSPPLDIEKYQNAWCTCCRAHL